MAKTKDELAKMSVVELKAALKALGQPVTGKKDELVERLLAAQQATDKPDTETAPTDANGEAGKAPATQPAAEAQPPSTNEAVATAQATDSAAEDAKDSKGRSKIVFSDEAAKAAASTKVAVIKPAAAPVTTKTVIDKLKARSERFKDPEVEKAKQRAQRFGTFNPDLEKERARKRAERFGTYNEELEEERKAKRAERFGIDDPEAILAARAARFGLPTTTPATATSNGAGKEKATGSGGKKGKAGAKSTGSNPEFEAAMKARAARFGL